jgi:hypothetical protein
MTNRSGTCLCGEIKYTLSAEPLAARICWCRDCQKLSANGTVNILVPTESFQYSGTPNRFVKTADSGNQITRSFCPKCGTHVFASSSARPQFTVVRAGTLADPSSIRPTMNIWVESAPEWACMDPALEAIDKQPVPPQQPQK